VRPVLSELSSLDASAVEKLRASGIPTPERLDRAVRREGEAAVASRTGVSGDVLGHAAREASLTLHKGMGAGAARLLQAAGIRSVADLASSDATELTTRLSQVAAGRGETPPRSEYVRVWVRAARTDGRPRR
jgi:predicted flap endonuclease-1-like 5' DNA nuclease